MKLSSFMTRLCLISTVVTVATVVQADDTRDTSCRTTQECAEQAKRLRGVVARDETSAMAKAQDQFYWMNRINMASTVMLVEKGIIAPGLVKTVAGGVRHGIVQATQPGGKRPEDVLQLESIIAEKAGPEATLVHTGRSRQDMLGAIRTMRLRRAVLDTADVLMATREQLIEIASKHTETFVPAYTNGVQAQPISYGHYLMAFADSLARDAQRIRDFYPRLNLSAMGAAVLANSSWPLDRPRLAELLGFDGLAVNSYDATQIINMDVQLEASAIMSSMAIRIGAMLQDIHIQYHQSNPWLLLDAGQTYTSSAMPQKANPGVVQTARARASDVIAANQMMILRNHNVTPGMTDYRATGDASRIFVMTVDLLNRFNNVMKSLGVNGKRSLEELNGDWTTSMELAETLQRLHNVPFRIGHHFASLVVTNARKNSWRPTEFPYADAVKIYAEATQHYRWSETRLPLDEKTFKATLSPEMMVRTRVGIGGPQPAEVVRMIGVARDVLATDREWLNERNNKLLEAEAKLNTAFAKLL